MRALVTGAAGFLGAHAVQGLLARGLDVVAVVRPGAPAGKLRELAGRLTVAEADLARDGAAAALLRAHPVELLLHLAWYARPADYLTSLENVGSLSASAALFAAAADAGCRRIVGVGTCLEYAASAAPHREDDPAAPDTLYAACKHAARLAGEEAAGGRSFAWARIFHVHGPGEDPARLVPFVASRLRRGEPVELSPGEQVRDYLRAEDVADALATLALSDVRGPVNVCSGEPVTLRRLLTALGEALGRPDLLRFGALPYRPGERMRIAGEPAKLRGLGWHGRSGAAVERLGYLKEPA